MTLLSRSQWIDRIGSGDSMLGDGAVGSLLMEKGIAPEFLLKANKEFPDIVRQLHRGYLEAGSECLTSNTFGIPDGQEWRDYVRAGLEICIDEARKATREIGVLFSLVPQALIHENVFISSLLSGLPVQPTALLIETGTHLPTLVAAVSEARSFYDDWLIVTCHFTGEGRLLDGIPVETVARTLIAEGVDVIGANCCDDSWAQPSLVKRFQQVGSCPLLIQPNAGIPQSQGGHNLAYPLSPDDFALLAVALWEAGVSVVGGCCGTTPLHIASASSRRS